MQTASSIIHSKPSPLSTILLAGLIAGILDGSAASIQFMINSGGKSPAIVFKYISSALLGKEAYAGGTGMVILGIFLHILIATIFAGIFYLLYKNVNWISNNILLSGIIYGILVWVAMNRVVVPLSKIPRPKSFDLTKASIAMLILIFCIGIPIALITQYRMRKRNIS
jgi:hypothetical protein